MFILTMKKLNLDNVLDIKKNKIGFKYLIYM